MRVSDNKLVFERLVRPHFDRLFRLAWRLAGSKADAEDLFQELLIRAFGKLDELLGIDQPGPWLCRVMYNLFVDERRRFARQRMHTVDEGQLAGDGLAGLPGPDDPVYDQQRIETLERLDKALAQLSDEHRVVVLLHDTEGYKLTEIQDLTYLWNGGPLVRSGRPLQKSPDPRRCRISPPHRRPLPGPIAPGAFES